MNRMTPSFRPLAVCCVACLVACGSDDETGDVPVEIGFEATVGGLTAACDTEYNAVDAAGNSAMIADARLFVSEIELRTAGGEWRTLTLDQDSIWQTDSVALLDFEDGAGSCSSSGTQETNSRVTGRIAEGDYRGLRFTVGIPFSLNHLDDATAPAPLNSPGMFWAWKDGYKFVRVDWMPIGANRWNVHLGSRACDNDDQPNTAPPSSCGRSNRPRVQFDDFTPGDSLTLALDALIANADLASNLVDSPPGCMSAPMEEVDCAPVFSALGLDFLSGACRDDCATQTVFVR